MKTMSSARFAEIKKCISDYIDKFGYSPSLAEIAEETGIAQTSVYRYINAMVERGELDMPARRCVTPTNVKSQAVRVPVLGSIACGIPKFAEENIEEYVRLPVSLFGKGDFFILRAYGDSMIEAGIEDGDLVLIRQQNYADEGQIVVALIDDDATLKRFYPEPQKHRIRLHPENSHMDDIIVDHCEIQGVALKVLKHLE